MNLSWLSSTKRLLSIFFLMMTTTAFPGARAQSTASCTLHKSVYTCNWAAFRQILAASHTVWVPVDPMDRFTAHQLRQLAKSLGKSIAEDPQNADLQIDIVPAASTGISVGPAEQALATLRIFVRNPSANQPKLVWAETFRDHPDRPWASIVHATIEQFQARLEKSGPA